MGTAGLLLVLGISLSAGGTGADGHLLAGARAFREGRFDTALVEFRVAQALGSREAAAYAASALVKLDRPEEAVDAFGEDELARDALLDYYQATACYQARLYACADRLLAGIGNRSGPRIAEQVAKVRGAIAAALAKEPTQGAIDWYLAKCAASAGAGRAVLAAAQCREAAALSERRSDRYRHGDATSSLARLGDKTAGARR